MKKQSLIFIFAIGSIIFLSPSHCSGQENVPQIKRVSSEEMEVSMTNPDANLGSISHPYSQYGPNYKGRHGFIVNFNPKLVRIDKFSFGNTEDNKSQYQYMWTVLSKDVLAFSITTFEKDAFNNWLPSSTWIMPIDDNGKSVQVDPTKSSGVNRTKTDHDGFEVGKSYVCTFDGPATSADVLPFNQSNLLSAILPKSTKDNLPFGDSKPWPELHPEEEGHRLGFGRSTRYTVLTFVSCIRCKADGKDQLHILNAKDIKALNKTFDDEFNQK